MQTVYQRFRDRRDAPLSQRAVALLLAIGLQLLVILALLKLDDRLSETPETDRPLSTFSLLPGTDGGGEPSRVTPKPTRSPTKPNVAPARPALKTPSERPIAPTAKSEVAVQNPLFGNKALFDGANIAALPKHPDDEPDSNAKDQPEQSASTYGPGIGPGGVHAFNASWRRLPTKDELAFYLPHDLPDHAVANIMCMMLPDYHVENCRAVDEAPPGTGLARGLREAAWQFRINPPRVGGKVLLNRWVIIHFDWSTIRSTD